MNYMRQSNTFIFDKNPSAKNAQSIDMIMHEALLLKKFLQTKPPIKNEKINYYDLYYTIILNLSDERGEK